jgi:tetratricopeptide (TPR) repeat protein
MKLDAQDWHELSRHFDELVELEAHARHLRLQALQVLQPELAQALRRMLDAHAQEGPLDRAAGALVAGLDRHDDSGTTLGAWRLLRKLGQGGMGTVYEAERADGSGQRAAIKCLRTQWQDSDQAARFHDERRILGQLSHPGIPRLLDHGTDASGTPWFALEYVGGGDLLGYANSHLLGLDERVRLLIQVCAAVQHAHTRFIVHRDLKPGNILVDEHGRARVLDFGVAKRLDLATTHTRTGLAAGFTPGYAAPEQLANGQISAATDVYALGAILYELLSGRRPLCFDPADLHAAVRASTSEDAPSLRSALLEGDAQAVALRCRQRGASAAVLRRMLTSDLERVVQTALAKEPARRYASVQALQDDLERILAGHPVSVLGNTAGYRLRRFVGRNRWGVGMALLAVVAVLAGLGASLWQLHQARIERDIAATQARRNAAIGDYFAMLFRQAGDRLDPGQATAANVLADGARRIADSYRDDPATGIELAVTSAELSQRLGDLKAAQALYEQVLQWPEIERHPQAMATARYGLGVVRYFNGDSAGAAQLLHKAQAYWQRDRLLHAVDLLESASLQANLARSAGQAEQAVAVLETAIAQWRERVGPGDDRVVAARMAELAGAHVASGDFVQGRALAEQAWAMFGRLGLQSTSDALGALNNAAVAAAQNGDLAAAEQAFAQAVALYRQANPESPHLASLLSNQGTLVLRQGRAQQARGLLEQALEMGERLGGHGSRVAMGTRHRLVQALQAMDEQAAAMALNARQLQLAEEVPLGNEVWLAQSLLVRAADAQRRNDPAWRVDAQRVDALLEHAGPHRAALDNALGQLHAASK